MSLRCREVTPGEAATLTPQLLGAGAPLYQLPYWNEAHRTLGIHPRYLTCVVDGRVIGFVSVISIGVPGLQLGLIRRGPVRLDTWSGSDAGVVHALADWARREGYVFLRFSQEDEGWFTALREHNVERFEAFPCYRDFTKELIVPQEPEAEAMLDRFGVMARRWIDMASKVGYRIEVHDSAERFAEAWPRFQAVAREKRIRFRPLSSWQTLIREARRHDAVRVYTALWEDDATEVLLVVRDQKFAYPIIGALHVTQAGRRVNPSFLLHWRAMRDCHTRWGTDYNLNSPQPRSFKRQFRPLERDLPPPAVMVLRQPSYRVWRWGLRWSPQPRALKRFLFAGS